MEIRQLKYFAKIVEVGSVNQAAKALNVAQPAISRQIRRLEDEFGVLLLTRSSHGVSPTRAGEQFNRYARYVLRSVDRLSEKMSEISGQQSGLVRLGIPPSVGMMFMDKLLSNLKQNHPRVNLLLTEGSSYDLERLLDRGDLDLAVLTDTETGNSTRLRTIWQEYMYFVRSTKSSDPALNALAPDIDIADIAGVPLILTSRPKTAIRLIREKYIERNISFNLEMEVEGVATIKNLVSRGHGYTILPFPTVAIELSSGLFKAHRIKELTAKRQIAWVRGVEPNAAARTVINELENQVGQAAPDAPWICPDSKVRASRN